MRGAYRASHRQKLYSPPQSSFTLCIQLNLVADKTTRILCLPGLFLNPLPAKVGLTEKGENYCFAWRTELAPEGTDLSGESYSKALNFGAGRITFVEMTDCKDLNWNMPLVKPALHSLQTAPRAIIVIVLIKEG